MIQRGEIVLDLLERADDDAAIIRGRGVELGASLRDLARRSPPSNTLSRAFGPTAQKVEGALIQFEKAVL